MDDEWRSTRPIGEMRTVLIPRWRVMTWLFLLVNAAMCAWLVAALVSASSRQINCGALDLQTCQNFYNAGVGVGVAAILVIWFMVFIVMSLLWLMTKPQRRLCPVCGHTVRRYETWCDRCNYDFYKAGLRSMGLREEPSVIAPTQPAPQQSRGEAYTRR